MKGSWFTFAAGRRAKWVVFAIWFVAIFIAAGPAELPSRFEDAENNEATSYLPESAESTHALAATEELQAGEIAPAVIIYRRDSGKLTAADFRTIEEDVGQMTETRFPGVIPDGATAAAGGKTAKASAAGGGAPAPGQSAHCAGPTTTIPGQPADYAPFVGPVCSEDGQAAIVNAYINAEGEGDAILDPVKNWREAIEDPPAGLEAKITGGAGFSADGIEVFESLNGTLLLAAVSLVIFLLIVIYRSPMFFLIPLAAVLFAETLSRSIGYGVSELGVTVNGQSSSIMSVLVLGAGTDYALLLVARYREELHNTDDKPRGDADRARLGRPGDLRLGGDGDRGAPLPDGRQGQRHRGPGPDRRDRDRLRRALDADPAAGAADDLRPPRLLALRPAHARDGAERRRHLRPRPRRSRRRLRLRRAAAGRRRLAAGPDPAAAGAAQLAPASDQPRPHPLADRRPAGPGRLHALRDAPQRARARPSTPPTASGNGSATGSRLDRAGSSRLDRRPAGLLLRLRLLLDRPDQRRQLPHRSRIGRRPAPARQELPLRRHRADRHRRHRTPTKCRRCGKRWRGSNGVEPSPGRSPKGRPGPWSRRRLGPNPYSTEAFDLVEPIRDAAQQAAPGDAWSAARPRSNSTSATPPAGTRR